MRLFWRITGTVVRCAAVNSVWLCTDGIANGCSFLYSRCARIAKLMGYQKIITYTLATENGASLRASGWQCAPGLRGGGNWNVPGRPRADSRNTGPKRLYYKELR